MLRKKETFALKHLKRVIRWIAGIVVGLVFAVYLLLSLPFFQKWMAGKASSVLSDVLHTRVEIDRVQIGFLGRVIIDDLRVWDQQDKPMLFVTRTAAQMDVGELITNKHIIINSAQLFGADAHIYKEHPDSAYNFKFIVDAFAPKDTVHKPLPHIEIRSILVRHTDLTFDHQWKERKEGQFDPNHIAMKDLSVKAALDILTDDTLALWLDRLSFEEKCGFQITEGSCHVERGKKNGLKVSDFHLALSNSLIESNQLTYQNNIIGGDLKASLATRDFNIFYPPLRKIDDIVHIDLKGSSNKKDVNVSSVEIHDEKNALRLQARANVVGIKDSIPTVDASIDRLLITSNIEELAKPFLAMADSIRSAKGATTKRRIPTQLISQMGNTEINGHFKMDKQGMNGNVHLTSNLGNVDANGTFKKGRLKAHAEASKIKAGNILRAVKDSANQHLGDISATVDFDGLIKGHRNLPEGTAKVHVSELQFKDYTYHNIAATATRRGEQMTAIINSTDPNVLMDAEFRANLSNSAPSVIGFANINSLDLQSTHLLNSPKMRKVSTKVGIEFEGNTFDNMAGSFSIPHVIITDDNGDYTLTNFQLRSNPEGEVRHVRFTSPYARFSADGRFTPTNLGVYVKHLAHSWLPDFVKTPNKKTALTDATFKGEVTDLSPLQRITGKEIGFGNGSLVLNATLDSEAKEFKASAKAPAFKFGDMELTNIQFSLDDQPEKMNTLVSFEKAIKGTPVEVKLNVQTEDNKLNTRFEWDNHKEVKNRGSLQLRGTLERNAEGGLAANAEVLPTDVYINDTLWGISNSQLYFRNKELYIDNFRFGMAGNPARGLCIHGTASQDATDSVIIDARELDLEYIFTVAQVKPLTLGGYATGQIVGTSLFKSPLAVGNVFVPHFLFNGADMGDCTAHLVWGREPGQLDLSGFVVDKENNGYLNLDGYLHLIKDPDQYLDLNLEYSRANCAFMERYVKAIMKDFTGRASGKMHIMGKFKEVEIEGDVFAHECALSIPMLNTRYYAYNQSLHLHPGGVVMKNVVAYDREGKPGMNRHCGTINGEITYEYFRNMHYNFDIEGTDILAYDTKEFGDMPFYATAYGSGKVNVNGGPGYVNIDINATPTGGSLTYNASSPETLTNAGFLSFVNRSEQLKKALEGEEEEEKPTNDMHIEFDLHVIPNAQLRLLMDPRTDDYISLYGNANLKCSYYNKGAFKMYGTYEVDHGTYKMTIQDFIHKEFQFRKGGTLTFSGNPFNADLGLQAIYTVPSVQLNDLSARGTFSNSTVRVNCLMNLGGKAGAPQISFDFDIPNVNEDELRMVRSLISTEEERNLQVIYLLGIGRFYTYDYSGSQQSSTAMNSLLSSTLSGQLNQLFNNMTGNSNWNIGANLSTGNMGWSDMDVEGMLSGRLLNNRLLINGNFGYRDNPVAASNFIGDFDIQYLLNKKGSLVLKAYSETNDRYFTKSALTTQGIGLMVKKDFTNLSDLFSFLKKKKKNKNVEATTTTEVPAKKQ